MSNGSDHVAAMNVLDRKDWETPAWLVRGVERRHNLRFTLDAAASDANHKAPIWLTELDDALNPKTTWGLNETVWINPPYGDAVPLFIEAARQRLDSGEARTVVFLIPNATENAYWTDLIEYAYGLVFLTGRVSFILNGKSQTGNTRGSVLVFLCPRKRVTRPLSVEFVSRDLYREIGETKASNERSESVSL